MAIGTVSTEAKAQAVADAGGDYPIVRSEGNFAERVHEITDGEGVAVVHKSIGRNTV
jgi:NADPH2:quinone reductase